MSETTPTVSELTRQIRDLLEPRFDRISVRGELSNVNQSRNGHLYMTLKDPEAQLPAVMWRSRADRLDSALKDGDEVILEGSLQIYPPHGRYQLVVERVRRDGVGQLQAAFERLKETLREEGLFDETWKRPLPRFPRAIAVITSETGAAFHDICSTLERRWPMTRVVLVHASVQGERAAGELVGAMQQIREREDLDLLIIGRGGGSIEDLWPFNEETVARALFRFPIPTVSAVGHETDFSITDFVADRRAATPTQAAELAVPDQNEIRMQLEDRTASMSTGMERRLSRFQDRVRYLGESHALKVIHSRLANLRQTVAWHHSRLTLAPRVHRLKETLHWHRSRLSIAARIRQLSDQLRGYENRIQTRVHSWIPIRRERLDRQQERLNELWERRDKERRNRLTTWIHRLEKRDPDEPLDRGFVRVWRDGTWLVRPEKMGPDQTLELEWREDRVRVRTQSDSSA